MEVLVFVGHWTDIEIWFILYNCNIERKSIYIFSLRIFHWVVYNLNKICSQMVLLTLILLLLWFYCFCIMCTVYVKGIKASWNIILSKGFIVNKMYLKFLNLWHCCFIWKCVLLGLDLNHMILMLTVQFPGNWLFAPTNEDDLVSWKEAALNFKVVVLQWHSSEFNLMY